MTLGDTVLGKIRVPGEQHEFRFSGQVGQQIYLDPLQYTGLWGNWTLTVSSPSGQEVLSTNLNANHILTLTEEGSYTLVLDATGSQVGHYGFSLIDLDVVPHVEWDMLVEGTLAPGTEDDVYRFSGRAGQHLFFDDVSRSGTLTWQLYDPYGNAVPSANKTFSTNGWGYLEVRLPHDGDYILALKGTSSFTSTVGYAFQIVTPDTLTQAIEVSDYSNPQAIDGELTEKGEIDRYTFTGAVGQRLFFDQLFMESDYRLSHDATLVSPTGKTVLDWNFGDSGLDPLPITLTEAGTYTLMIDARDEHTGSYSFSLIDIDSATPLETDTRYTGALDPGQELHLYEFKADPGQRLYFDTSRETRGATWTLYSSGNVKEREATLSSDMEYVFDTADTYLLAIRGSNGVNPVHYGVEVVTPEIKTVPLTFNEPVIAQIAEKGERDIYTFTGRRGQALFFDILTDAVNTQATLLTPSGSETGLNQARFNSRSAWTPFFLPEGGPYQLVIDGVGEPTEDYGFQLLDLDQAPLLAMDTLVEGMTLTPGTEIQVYRIDGTAGHRLYFDAQHAATSGQWHVYGPGLQQLTSTHLSSDFEVVLPADGIYYLMLRGESTTPVDYQIQVVASTSSEQSLSMNRPVTGSIRTLGERDRFTLNGSQGQMVYVDAHAGNASMTLTLTNPSGHEVYRGILAADGVPLQLNQTGAYTLWIDGQADATGDYRFTIVDQTTTLTVDGGATSGRLSAGETTLYQFAGRQGQQLQLDNRDSTAEGTWTVYLPPSTSGDYTPLISGMLSEGLTATLPMVGDYLVVVSNSSETDLNYRLQVQDVSVSPVVNSGFGVRYEGTEDTEYTLQANAGTLVFYDGIQTTVFNSSTATLTAPDGSRVFSGGRTDSNNNVVVLKQTGDYRLTVNTQASYSFQLLDLETATPVPFNEILTVSIPKAGSVAYRFEVDTNERIWLDRIVGNSSVQAKLFDRAGRQLFLGSGDSSLLQLQAGDYYLVLDGSQSTTTNVQFQIVRIDTAREQIEPEEEIRVTFEPRHSVKSLVINGEAGERLYFDAKTSSNFGQWSFFTPDGQRISHQPFRDFEVELPVTGEYLIVLSSDSRSPVGVTFEVFASVTTTSSIKTGQVIEGALETPGQQHHYTLEVESGQHLYFDNLKATSHQLDWKLESPSGKTSFSSDFTSNQLIFLSEPGTYRLTVDGAADHGEDYRFQILDLENQNQVPTINLDERVTGTFETNAPETDLYRFNAKVNQYVYFNRFEGGVNSSWIVRDHSGVILTSNRLVHDFEHALPYSGDYFLEIIGDGNTAGYAFELVTSEWPISELTFGQATSGELTKAGERQMYTFEGVPGQMLYFDHLASPTNLLWQFISPTGEILFNQALSSDQLQTLDEAGTYTIVIDGIGEAVGSYKFQVWDWANPAHAQPIAFDRLIKGDFGETGREADFYRFKAQKGEYLYFDRSVGDLNNTWTLYSRSGEIIANHQLIHDFELTLPYSGDYFIRGFGNTRGNGYEFEVVTPVLTTEKLLFGTVVTGEIAGAGDRRRYTFEGEVGQLLYFDSLKNSSLHWRLYTPSGTEVLANSSPGQNFYNDQMQTLSESGQYTLVVDGNGDETDTFRFQVMDLNDASASLPLELNTPVRGTFEASQRDAVFYRFTGEKGTYMYFESEALPGGVNQTWTLYDATGNQIQSSRFDFELSLPKSGDYFLRIFGAESGSDYGFKVVTSEWNTTKLTFGETISGELIKAGEQHHYTFNGSLGQQLYFDPNLASNSTISAKLYDPYGNQVFNRSFTRTPSQSDAAFTLTEAGEYLLVIDGLDNSPTVGTYQFQLSDRREVASLPIEKPISGTLAPSQTHLYQFNGEQGEVFSFDLSAEQWSGANWVLYDSSNQIMAQPNSWNPDFSRALPTSGLYTLAIMSSSDSPVGYEFLVRDISPPTVETVGLGIAQQGTFAAGETVDYVFTATAGTQVFYDSLNQSHSVWQVRTRLINPDGSYAFDNHSAGSDKDPFILQQSGKYTLQVYGVNESVSGRYEFNLQELRIHSNREEFNAVEFGRIITGDLSGKENKVYSFEGVAGTRMLFNGMEGNHVSARLYDPNGKKVFNLQNFRTQDSDLVTLALNGTYHLVIEGELTSSRTYQFQLLDIGGAQPIQLNVPISGVLETGRTNTFHPFSGTKGQHLYFQSSDAPSTHLWQLIGPDNRAVVTSRGLNRDFEVMLSHTGLYTLRVMGNSSQTTPIPYQFKVLTPSVDNTVSIITPGTGETASNDDDSLGVFPVKLSVEDGRGGTDTQEFNIRLWPDPENTNPVITSIPTRYASLADSGYVYQIDAFDPDGDELQYRLIDGPTGTLLNQTTGELLWFPESAQTGDTVSFSIEVADNRGGYKQQTFDVGVFSTLGTIQGVVFDDINQNGVRDNALIQGDQPNLVFAIDVSGSAGHRRTDWTTTSLDEFEFGGGRNTVLDQEIATVLAMSEQLDLLGLGDRATISVVLWSERVKTFPHGSVGISYRILNMPAADGDGTAIFTTPNADHNQNGIRDITEVLNFNSPFGGTNFDNGLRGSQVVLDLLEGDGNLLFLSDGFASNPDSTLIQALRSDGVNIKAFGIGENAGLDTLQQIDPDAVRVTGTEELIDVFGGWDTRFTDEALIQGITIYLDLNNNSQRDVDEPFQVTGPDERPTTSLSISEDYQSRYQFQFENLAPGEYVVRQEVPEGYVETRPTGDGYIDTITVDGGEVHRHLFGLYQSEEVGNQPPVIVTPAPSEELEVGERIEYVAQATDPNPDELTFDLPLAPEGMVVDSETGLLAWVPSADQVGTHNMILRVQDGEGGVDLQAFDITVAEPNRSPAFTSVFSEQVEPQVGKTLTYEADAMDPDGDDLTYRLVDGLTGATIDADTGVLTWTPAAAGEADLTLKVTDGQGGEDEQRLTLTVIEAQPNRSPVIRTSTPRSTIRYEQPYIHQFEAVDPDGDGLRYRLVTAPDGMTLSDAGLLTWVPTVAQAGAHAVTVEIDDSQGGVTPVDWTITVSYQAINHAPVITSVPDNRTTLTKGFTYAAQGRDVDGDSLLWSLDEAPEGMVVDALTGQVSWNPEAHQVGRHRVQVRATDPSGLYAGQDFEVQITGENTPPSIVSEALTEATIGEPYRYAVEAVDPEDEEMRFRLGVQPAGMTIDPETGVIDWTPETNQTGSHEVEVLVQDAQGGFNRQRYTLEVGTESINHGPSITSTPVFQANAGRPYRYPVKATDPDQGDVLSYALIEAPTGMTVNRTGRIQWKKPKFGTHKVVVGVTDQQGLGAAQGFTVTVLNNQAPVIRSTPKTEVNRGDTYQYDVVAVDPDNQALTYRLDQGSVARGMTIDGLGRLRWTPMADGSATDVPVTDVPVTVTVTDALGAGTEQSFTVSVVSDEDAPLVSLKSSLTPLYVGQDVTFDVRATDNVEVTDLQVLINGEAVALTNSQVTLEQPPKGEINATVIAADAAGNLTTETLKVPVIDPSVGEPPTVELTPLDGVVTGPIQITGTAADDDLVSYALSVAPVGTDDFQEIITATESVTDGVLGTFDPTLLANDAYRLRLTATDQDGNEVLTERTVMVGGDLKLGNFTLSFTDLEIPLAGIPIQVTRTYDSLNAQTTDDFGYGWRLEFRDTDLRTSVAPPSETQQLLGRLNGFDEQTRVYVTLPGGKREGFTFAPKRAFISQFLPSVDGVDTSFYEPAFKADDGVTSTLRVNYDGYINRRPDGAFINLGGSNFNPEDAANFGGVYVLTTKDGMEYKIDAQTGDLLTMTDLNGNQLTFSDDGIVSDTGVQVAFKRDRQGRITSVIDPDRHEVRYGYDANGDLVSVTDRENHTTRLEYHDERDHYLDSIIDPLGREGVRAQYDEETGRLSQLLDVNGEAIALIYDPENSIQTVKDVFGNPTTYEYDARGNVVQEVDAVGKMTRHTYDDHNNVLTETVITKESGPKGWTTTYTYDDQGNERSRTDPLGNVTRSRYDKHSRLLSESDALGNTTTYDYSPSGNLKSSQDALGHETTYGYDLRGNLLNLTDADQNETAFRYDRFGNVEEITDADGNVTTYTYNGRGDRLTETRTLFLRDDQGEFLRNKKSEKRTEVVQTTWTYDNEGRVKTITDAENNVTRYDYDATGNQISVINGRSYETKSVYDEECQLVETILPDDTPNDDRDNLRTIDIYDRGDRRRASIDSAGRVTHYVYDAVGRLVSTIEPDGVDTLKDLLTIFEGAKPGQAIHEIDWTNVTYPDTVPDYLSDNPHHRTEYDSAGRTIASIDARGNRTEYRYDDAGRLTHTLLADDTPNDLSDNPTTRVTYDKAGRRMADTDALGQTTRYTYDKAGRLITTTFHDGTTTHTQYDKLGRRTAITDPEGHITRYDYDKLGRLSAVRQYLNQDSDTLTELKTEYHYDELGRLIAATDANQHSTRYEYDKLDRRTAVQLPKGQRSTTTYDEMGNITSSTDFNEAVTSYTYDALDRLTVKDYPDDADVTYTYTADGQIKTLTDSRGTTTFDYDPQGRLLWRNDLDDPTTADGHTIEYEYDEGGNRTAVITPNGRVDYTFDEQNRLQTVTDPDDGVTTYTYDNASNLVRTAFPNDTVEMRGYDDLNRLTFLKTVHIDPDTGTEAILSGFDYTLNDAGHRLSVTEFDGRVVDYTYDDLYRLTEENINQGERTLTYTYDNVGNRLTRHDSAEGLTTYRYDENDRLVTETLTSEDGTKVHVVTYDYDDNGHLISRTHVSDDAIETTAYTWNDDNRLVAVETPEGDRLAYAYDDDGIRVSTTVNGETTEFLVDKNRPYAQVLEEFSSSDLEAFYVYGHDLISQTRNGEQDVYHVDGLGSTRGLTDEDGTVTDTYDYEAFGELIDSTGESKNSYRFTGEQFDEALGDYYLRDRFYDTSSGRFLRRDVYEGNINYPITINRYIYGNSNPVEYTDPNGLFSIAEANTASSIANTLNSIQFDTGQHLVTAILGGNDYQATQLLREIGFGVAISLIPIAAPFTVKGLANLQRKVDARSLANSLEELRLTKTVALHLNVASDTLQADGGRFVQSSRPFVNSPLLMKEIMRAKTPIRDPRGVPTALR